MWSPSEGSNGAAVTHAGALQPHSAANAELQNVRHVFFDLDGTLADSLEGLRWSIEVAFAAAHRTEPETDLRRWIGPGIRVILKNMDPTLQESDLDTMERAFRAHYDSVGVLRTAMFDGVASLLPALRQRGIALYIVTNKPATATAAVLRTWGMEGVFDAVVSRNSREPAFTSKGEMLAETARRFHADARLSVMVGDTAEDAEAAAHAGMRFIHAGYGYGTSPQHGGDAIAHAADLLALLQAQSEAVPAETGRTR